MPTSEELLAAHASVWSTGTGAASGAPSLFAGEPSRSSAEELGAASTVDGASGGEDEEQPAATLVEATAPTTSIPLRIQLIIMRRSLVGDRA